MKADEHIERLRRMLDPARWPVKKDDILILHDGEIWAFRTDDPLEECVYRPLYRWP